MANLQVRSIDDHLYKALGCRAVQDNRSISQEVVAILKAYLSYPSVKHANSTEAFLELCGTWQDDKNEKQIVTELRECREPGNRFVGNLF